MVKWQLLFSLVSSFSTLWFRVEGHHGEYIGYELGTSILVDQLKHLSLLHIVSFHLATPNLTCSQFFSTDFSCLCLLVQSENSVFWSPLLTYIHSVHGNHSRIYVWTMHSASSRWWLHMTTAVDLLLQESCRTAILKSALFNSFQRSLAICRQTKW